jgi:site-specific recombinase XerD
MKPTDFAYHLTNYLSKHLPGVLGLSPNTILSYRDTFSLLLVFLRDKKGIPCEKVTMETVSKELVLDFLKWLEDERGSSVSTRNQRSMAIHAFFKYLQTETPEYIFQCQQMLTIKKKKTESGTINFLSTDAIKALLDAPDSFSCSGRRDTVLLSLMYDTGARVQEIADLCVMDIRLAVPASIKITGKGSKTRIVPLQDPVRKLLEQYLKENGLDLPMYKSYPLFQNKYKSKITRAGITYILKKHFETAKKLQSELFPDKVSPHSMRHSKGMHLRQGGVNLVYIRDLLGHESIETTEIYAKTDSEMKRKALEEAALKIVPSEQPEWQKNTELLNWLKNLGK